MERASSSDAFGLLGLPAQFDLDPQVIEDAFFEKSKETHPDRFATAPAAERVVALSRSRAINDAYKTLKDPIARAAYLLNQAGVKIGDNEQLPGEALVELLEQREELQDAIAAKRIDEIEQRAAAMAATRKQAVAALPRLFAANDLAAIKRELIMVRYYDRYLEACDTVLRAEDE